MELHIQISRSDSEWVNEWNTSQTGDTRTLHVGRAAVDRTAELQKSFLRAEKILLVPE